MSIRRGVLRICAILGTAVLAVAGTGVPASANDPFATLITNTSAHLCATLANPSSGSLVSQIACNPANSAEMWSFNPAQSLPTNPMVYTVYNDGRGLCLAGYAGPTRGIPAFALTCDGSTTQQWTLVGVAPHLSIRNVSSGMCLVGGVAPGSVYLGGCPDQPSQGQWSVSNATA